MCRVRPGCVLADLLPTSDGTPSHCYGLLLIGSGYLNGPATNEPMFACFEFVPVILAAGLWSIVPPSAFIEDKLPGSEKRAQQLESEKPKLVHAPSEESDASTRV